MEQAFNKEYSGTLVLFFSLWKRVNIRVFFAPSIFEGNALYLADGAAEILYTVILHTVCKITICCDLQLYLVIFL